MDANIIDKYGTGLMLIKSHIIKSYKPSDAVKILNELSEFFKPENKQNHLRKDGNK